MENLVEFYKHILRDNLHEFVSTGIAILSENSIDTEYVDFDQHELDIKDMEGQYEYDQKQKAASTKPASQVQSKRPLSKAAAQQIAKRDMQLARINFDSTSQRPPVRRLPPPVTPSTPLTTFAKGKVGRFLRSPLVKGAGWGLNVVGAGIGIYDSIVDANKAYKQDGIGGAISVGSAELLRLGAGGIGARFGGPWGSGLGYTAVDQALAASGLAWKEAPPGMSVEYDRDAKAAKIGSTAQKAAIAAGKEEGDAGDEYWKAYDAERDRQNEEEGLIDLQTPISTMPPIPGLIDKVQSSKRLRSQVAEINAVAARSNERRDQKVAQADAERARDRAEHAEWMARHEVEAAKRR